MTPSCVTGQWFRRERCVVRVLSRVLAALLVSYCLYGVTAARANCPGWSMINLGQESDAQDAPRCDWQQLAEQALAAQMQRDQLPTRGVGKQSRTPAKLGADPIDRKVEDAVRKAARPAVLALNVPDKMETGKPATVTAVLLTAMDQDTSRFASSSGGQETTQAINITPDMQIAFLGADFEVTPAEADWRTLTRMAPAAWTWKLVTETEGVRNVTFSIRGKVKIGDDEKYFDINHVARSIPVIETDSGKIVRYASLLQQIFESIYGVWVSVAAIGGAFFAFVLRFFRKRGKVANAPSAKRES